MLISTVCKTHGFIANSCGPILSPPFFFLHLDARVTYARRFNDIVIDTPCSIREDRSTRASGKGRTHRSRFDRFLIFTSEPQREEEEIPPPSRPTLRSRSAGRSLRISGIASHLIFRVASGRAPVSLTMACVLNWSPCRGGTRRYTVYKYH